MNRLHALFKERNPTFDGEVYIGGHSLGSLILFDLLCHQKPIVKSKEEEDDNDDSSDKGVNICITISRVLRLAIEMKLCRKGLSKSKHSLPVAQSSNIVLRRSVYF